MNGIYRVVWNHARQTWVAASELANSRGKTGGGKAGVVAGRAVGSLPMRKVVTAMLALGLMGGAVSVQAQSAGGAGALGIAGHGGQGDGGGGAGGESSPTSSPSAGTGSGSNGSAGRFSGTGGGSGGGVGQTIASTQTITGLVSGGNAQNGGNASAGGSGGGGGGGGAGVLINTGTLSSAGTIQGGRGGDGGGGFLGGGGGGGGTGVLANTGTSLSNTGTIQAGDGGNGGNGVTNGGGGGGGGGTGVLISSGTLSNAGTIQGGNGGTGSDGGSGGAGGAGVSGSNMTITNSGTISGGLANGGSGAQGDAIRFTGGTNSLTIETTNAALNGPIELNAGTVEGTTVSTVSATIGAAVSGVTLTNAILLDGSTSALTLSSTNDFGVSGIISGSGNVTVNGNGTLTLSGTNTYSGGTTITGGTLAISSDGNLGASAGALTFNGGTLQTTAGITSSRSIVLSGNGTIDTDGVASTISGRISGGSNLTVASSIRGGSLTLTNTNTYTGATTINSGATLSLSGAGSVAASSGVTDNGTFDISGTTAGASIASLAGTGTVALGTQSLTLMNASGTFGGTITGSGKLLTQGSGSQIFDGNSSSFTGTTEITGGLLEVGDINTPSAVLGGDVQVDAAGTLRGHGTVTGSVTNNGTVMPGGTVGTLTVGGNYTQASAATLSIEVSPTAASALAVSGTATLGGTLAITYDPGTYSARSYTLVSAHSLSGTFASTTSTGTSYLGTLTTSVTYGANNVQLVLADAVTPDAPAAPVVVAPTDTSIYTAVGTSALLGAQATGAALLDRLDHASAATAGHPDGWVAATGVQTKVEGTNSEPGFQTNRYGFLAGLDQKLGDYTVGMSAGYDHSDIDEQGTGDSGTIDTLRAALYGSRFVGPVSLAATLGVGLDFLSQKRPFGDSTGTAEGNHMGQDVTTGAQASLPMRFGDVTVTPRVGLRYAYFHANGFGESGAGGEDLNVGTDNVHSLQPYAGVTLDKAFGDAVKPVNVELRLGYARELLDVNRTMTVAAQDGTGFAAPGTNLPRGYLTTGASVTLHPTKNMDVSLNYDTVINTDHASAQQGSIRVGYQF